MASWQRPLSSADLSTVPTYEVVDVPEGCELIHRPDLDMLVRFLACPSDAE
jgi:hypothetical protein